jgi:hypothetical protein
MYIDFVGSKIPFYTKQIKTNLLVFHAPWTSKIEHSTN